MQGEYAIVRYVPQPERGEFVNLGVVLVSGSQGSLWTRFRDSSSFKKYPLYLRPPNEVITSFEKHLQRIPEEKGKEELSTLLENLRHDLQNSIQTGEPHPCTFEDPVGFLLNVFR